MQSTFITLIGHQLRTPLSILFRSLRMLDATSGNGVNKSLISSACRCAEQLIGLVETIIPFSNASTGELHLNERVTDFGDILESAVELVLPGPLGKLKTIKVAKTSIALPVFIAPTISSLRCMPSR